jgi:hypothetical protein
VTVAAFDAGVALNNAMPVHVVATPLVDLWSWVAESKVDVVVYADAGPLNSVVLRVIAQAQRHPTPST